MVSRGWLAIGVLGLALTSVGCQDGRDSQIQALQERIQGLEGENADLSARLEKASQDASNSSSRALQLQQMLDDLRKQAASSPPVLEASGWTRAGPYAWIEIGEPTLFDPGKATLKAGAKPTLQKVADDLKTKFANTNIWVVGHTDNDPVARGSTEWKDNWELSLERSRVVTVELTKMGVNPRDLVAGGQGEFNPVAPNDSSENKLKNRRVVVIAVTRPVQIR
jgi:chemotaxis protein MotB